MWGTVGAYAGRGIRRLVSICRNQEDRRPGTSMRKVTSTACADVDEGCERGQRPCEPAEDCGSIAVTAKGEEGAGDASNAGAQHEGLGGSELQQRETERSELASRGGRGIVGEGKVLAEGGGKETSGWDCRDDDAVVWPSCLDDKGAQVRGWTRMLSRVAIWTWGMHKLRCCVCAI